jgi:hypothetical protein
MAEYIIGIDLGTTNCTLAYVSKSDPDGTIHQFPINQDIGNKTQDKLPCLPSFLYVPLEEESNSKICLSPSIGQFAKKRGSEVPDRMISSAKSWICHAGIDRREKLLPASEDITDKMSPLDVCSKLLMHIKEAWDQDMSKTLFKDQEILITVPASFDPSARQLIQEAAENAGYPSIVLIEEPLAAFYSWISSHSNDWRTRLQVGDKILVVDIGGGTTDFTLISVENENGNLQLNRMAVGSHLLLGGDNLDLSLAYLAKHQFQEQGHNIDDWQMQALIHQCREAKEKFLGDTPPKHLDIVIQGRGSKLIGGSLKTQLKYKEVQELLLNGFFPIVSPQERSKLEKRSGLQQIGLPYAEDARITCQLAKFLSMTGENDSDTMEYFVMPTAVLFNGGTLYSSTLRDRIVQQLNSWAKELKKASVQILPEADYIYAVSRGAAYYGLSRQGKGIRVKSGTSRSYFIGVEDATPAVPGIPRQIKAICVVPFGMEEGTEQELTQQEFALVLGELATFRFFSHSTRQLSNGMEPTMGSIVKNWKTELTELNPIETILDKSEQDGKMIRVKIHSRVTELGILELECHSADARIWKLEFNLRERQPA